MKQICVVGVGYVGLVTAACFAELGNRVIALDVNEKRIDDLKKGIMPFYEPGLEELVVRNMRAGRISFTTSYSEALQGSEFAFIAVATPSEINDGVDLKYVAAAAQTIARNMTAPLIIVNKSTVPVGTGDWVEGIVKKNQPKPIPFAVVSCPEFLREGTAINDFMHSNRIILGSHDQEAAEKVAQLHLILRSPIVITDIHSAEMIKYASNAFLAVKISFINEIADACEAFGADVREVAIGMGYDKRIGPAMLEAGLGWGGSCFPKDVRGLIYMAKEKGVEPSLLNTAAQTNYIRRQTAVEHVKEMLGTLDGKTIGLLGLAFKPNTDDMREAPSVEIAQKLVGSGVKVRACDPIALEIARKIMPAVTMFADPYEMARDCDALMVITEWNEFRDLDLERIGKVMKTPVLFDGRNIYDPAEVRSLGFTYRGVGRGFDVE